MSELDLQEAILRAALDLQRLSASDEQKVMELMVQLEDDLRALLAASNLTEAGKRAVEALIKEAGDIIDGGYAAAADVVDTHQIALLVSEHTQEAMQEIIGDTMRTPSATTMSSLTKDVLIEGSPASAWWAKQSENLAFRFAQQVRQGVVNGETQERIVQRIVGRRGEPGILDVARRDARGLVHSSIMSAANQARLATFRANSDHIEGVRWLATLDGHTCPRCAALDGNVWDLEGDWLRGPTKRSIAFTAPPIHFNDRCVLSPVAKSFAELGLPGLDEAIAAGAQRASSRGPVSASMTFDQFFKRQSPAQQDAQFGPKRAQMFRKGAITVRDLISGTGRELTLEEIRNRA